MNRTTTHTHGTHKGNILRRKIERRKAKGWVNNFIVAKRIERGERNFRSTRTCNSAQRRWKRVVWSSLDIVKASESGRGKNYGICEDCFLKHVLHC